MKIVRKLGDAYNEVSLRDEDVFRVRDMIIAVMKNELPEEAHCIEALDYVLNSCKKELEKKIIEL